MNRRYDIDWLRDFALGLLIVYHISIVFQPWSYFIYFPQSEKPLESIWLVMGLINIWRIPLLFIISGENWKPDIPIDISVTREEDSFFTNLLQSIEKRKNITILL